MNRFLVDRSWKKIHHAWLLVYFPGLGFLQNVIKERKTDLHFKVSFTSASNCSGSQPLNAIAFFKAGALVKHITLSNMALLPVWETAYLYTYQTVDGIEKSMLHEQRDAFNRV